MEYERRNALEWQGRLSEGDSNSNDVSETEYSSDEDLPTTGPHPSYLQSAGEQARNETLAKAVVPHRPAVQHDTVRPISKTSPLRTAKVHSRSNQANKTRRPIFYKDSPAEARWRRKAEADGFFMLPGSYSALIMRLQKINGLLPRNANPFHHLNEIGNRTKTFIRTADTDAQKLLIWATLPIDVEAAKEQLNSLVQKAQLAKRPVSGRNVACVQVAPLRAMAKISVPTKQEIKSWLDRYNACQEVEFYRREPDTIENFSYTGIFLWPAGEIHPDETFGHGHAGLDYLRTFYGCFITYDRHVSAFKVLTNRQDGGVQAVQGVLRSLQVIFSESAARNSVPLEIYLIDPPLSDVGWSSVRMVESDLRFGEASIEHTTTVSEVPRREKCAELCGQDNRPEAVTKLKEDAKKTITKNRRVVKNAILECIARMAYFRGDVRMRVHIGAFVFQKYYSPKDVSDIPIDDFIRSMRDSNTKGSLSQVLVNRIRGERLELELLIGILRLMTSEAAERLFARVALATELFVPMDSSTFNLEDVIPQYTAIFQFPLGKSEFLDLRKEISQMKSEHTENEITDTQWTRDTRINISPLQLYKVPLQRELGWKTQISANNKIDEGKVDIEVCRFAAAITALRSSNTTRPKGHAELMFGVPRKADFPEVRHYFQQKTTWRYRLVANTAYVFEITRYDKFHFAENISASTSREPITTQWGFSLWCVAWKEKLVSNMNCKPGFEVSWKPTIGNFFPPNRRSTSTGPHSGFDDYLHNLQAVVDFLSATLCKEHEAPSRDQEARPFSPLIEL
ncbi:hypothetical protein MMC11_008608 [Xylographa trunciseda]|nr:hypothetical protein [Xylographa trunciseda]